MELLGKMIEHWPLGLNDTLTLLMFLGNAIYLLVTRQWKKLKEHIETESLKLINSHLSIKDKRDNIAKEIHESLPLWLKPFVSLKKVKKTVNEVYVNWVKPEVDINELKYKEEARKIVSEVDHKVIEEINELLEDSVVGVDTMPSGDDEEPID